MSEQPELTLRCWSFSGLAPELPTFDLAALVALSVLQLHAPNRFSVTFDSDELSLSGGGTRLAGVRQIVRGLDRRQSDEADSRDAAYLELALGRLGSLVLHSQVRECQYAWMRRPVLCAERLATRPSAHDISSRCRTTT